MLQAIVAYDDINRGFGRQECASGGGTIARDPYRYLSTLGDQKRLITHCTRIIASANATRRDSATPVAP